MVRLAQKAFHPGQLPVPAPARRHDLEVPGDDRVPRRVLPRERASTCIVHTNHEGRGRGHQPVRSRQPRSTPTVMKTQALLQALDKLAASTRRSAARAATRRSRAPRSASTRFRDRCRPVGPEEPAARALEPLQRQDQQGREHPRLPALATGPSSTSGSTSTSRTSPSCRSTSPPTRPVVERDGTLIMVDDERMRLAPRREARDEAGALPHARLLPAHRRDRVDGDDAAGDHPRRCCSRGTPSGRAG